MKALRGIAVQASGADPVWTIIACHAGKSGGELLRKLTSPTNKPVSWIGWGSRSHATPTLLPSAAPASVWMAVTTLASTIAPVADSELLTGPCGSTCGALPPLHK